MTTSNRDTPERELVFVKNLANCQIILQCKGDRAFWVKKQELKRHVDQDDLAQRNSKEIQNFYRDKWFKFTSHGKVFFRPPSFFFDSKSKQIRFINGRHRTLLLCKFLDLIPMALTQCGTQNLRRMQTIATREISPEESFSLPILPFNSSWKSCNDSPDRITQDQSIHAQWSLKINL